MPTTGIYGDVGSGKTTILIYFIVKYFFLPSIEKYANFGANNIPNWHKVDLAELTELPDTDKKRIVIRDEAYGEYDQRLSLTEESIFNTYVFNQRRKRNMDFVTLSQDEVLDIRLRRFEKLKIICRDRPIYNKDGSDYKGDFHYIFIGKRKALRFTLKYKDAEKLFKYFNTKELIPPRNFEKMKMKIKKNNPEKRRKVILEYVEKITKKIGLPCEQKDVTHNWVLDKMVDLEMDTSLEKFVYIKLRNKYG